MSFNKGITILLLVILAAGCGKAKDYPLEEEYVAKINNYTLTVADFKDDLKGSIAQKYLVEDPARAKRDILEELITRKILIQEAQRENFDKQDKFMKEIERYWEQALIKFFLKKKSQELSEVIKADKKEIAAEYEKMKRKILIEITTTDSKGNALSPAKTEWAAYGDLPRQLEDAAFALKAGEEKSGIPYGDNTVKVKVIKEEPVKAPPLEKVGNDLIRNILDKTKEAIFEKWVAGLRKGASIKINRKVLDEIEVNDGK